MNPNLPIQTASSPLAPRGTPGLFRNILVATDGSAVADRALDEAIALAVQLGAQLTVLSVLDVYAAVADMQMANEALFEHHMQTLRDQGKAIVDGATAQATAAGVSVRGILREAKVYRPAEAIVQEASEGYDLVVIGTHGRHGWPRLVLGSDAEEVLRRAPVPVLAVRLGSADDPNAHL